MGATGRKTYLETSKQLCAIETSGEERGEKGSHEEGRAWRGTHGRRLGFAAWAGAGVEDEGVARDMAGAERDGGGERQEAKGGGHRNNGFGPAAEGEQGQGERDGQGRVNCEPPTYQRG